MRAVKLCLLTYWVCLNEVLPAGRTFFNLYFCSWSGYFCNLTWFPLISYLIP